jgi:predicted metal-binding membrane protein
MGCWVLMLLLDLGGAISLFWIAAITRHRADEKLAP